MRFAVAAVLLAMAAPMPCGSAAYAAPVAAAAPVSSVRADAKVSAPVYVQRKVEETRGALLYSTHCRACHASNVYWRDKGLVTGLESLKFQVRRWQTSMGLNWTEDEISDVAGYLDAVYYGYSDMAGNFMEEAKPLQSVHKN